MDEDRYKIPMPSSASHFEIQVQGEVSSVSQALTGTGLSIEFDKLQ